MKQYETVVDYPNQSLTDVKKFARVGVSAARNRGHHWEPTMSQLTGKERIARILRHQSVDRVGLFEVFWRETATNWAAQGHFVEPAMVGDHFELDLRRLYPAS
jgi:hypothetical protein